MKVLTSVCLLSNMLTMSDSTNLYHPQFGSNQWVADIASDVRHHVRHHVRHGIKHDSESVFKLGTLQV